MKLNLKSKKYKLFKQNLSLRYSLCKIYHTIKYICIAKKFASNL